MYFPENKIKVDPLICGFSIRGFGYPRFTMARKFWKIKEINGS